MTKTLEPLVGSTTKTVALVANSGSSVYRFRQPLMRALAMYNLVLITPVDEYLVRIPRSLYSVHFPLRHLRAESIHPMREWRARRELLQIYRDLRPDLVLHFTPKAVIHGQWAARQLGIPAIPTLTGIGRAFIYSSFLAALMGVLYRQALRGSPRVLFHSPADMRYFRYHRMVIQHNSQCVGGSGVDLDFFRKGEGKMTPSYTFLFVGRLIRDKGIFDLIKALAFAKKSNPQITCGVLGPLCPQNKNAVTEDQLRSWEEKGLIRYLGEVDDVRPYLRRTRFLVHPSYREGCSRAILEAMAMQVPVLTTFAPGCAEVIGPRAGWTYPPGHVPKLTNLLLKLADLSEANRQRVGRMGRLRAEQRYDQQRVMETYTQLVQSALNPKPRRWLISAYSFAPNQSPGAIRIRSFYQYLRGQGCPVQVMTRTQRQQFPSDPTLVLPPASITDLPAWDLRSFFKQRKPEALTGRFARKLRNSFPFLLWLGDGGWSYLWAGYRQGLKRIHQHTLTHGFSSYRPAIDHLVLYLLKRRFPQLHWVADFRDLPVDPARRDTLWPGLQGWFWHQIARRADQVLVVSEGQKRGLPFYHPNVRVVPNGVTQNKVDTNRERPRYFTINYTGALYPGLQKPEVLAGSLNRLVQHHQVPSFHLRLQYAGAQFRHWQEIFAEHGLGAISDAQPLLPRSEALRRQGEAALNVVLSWSKPGCSGILTSKIYDYLAAGRPILVIINGPLETEWIQRFGQLPHVHLYATDQSAEELDRLILALYRQWIAGKPMYTTIDLTPFRTPWNHVDHPIPTGQKLD